MILKINGKETTMTETINSVHQVLEALEVAPRRVAVELNGEIIDPQLFTETLVHDKDCLEIVSFVGGG